MFFRYYIIIFTVSIFSSCGYYSISGLSISPEIKTVSIGFFSNYASLVNPDLSDYFTNEFRENMISKTTLMMVKEDGDIQFEGEIVDYNITPVSVESDNKSSLNRLTVKIKVRYYNNIEDGQNFEQIFSHYADYNADLNLDTRLEMSLCEKISDRIIQNAMDKALSNW